MNEEEIELLKETTIQEIRNSSNVFLIGHDSPDFDSIGSCIGLYELAQSLGKEVHIIVDDAPYKIESGVKKVMDENKEKYHFIKKEEVPSHLTEHSLLIMADTNKMNLISVRDHLDWFSRILIIDHHAEDNNTVQASSKIIKPEMSSVSEMVARVLEKAEVDISTAAANALLAGIVLDTKNYTMKATGETHDVSKKLIGKGADIDSVNNLFLEAFDSYCRIGTLIINGTQIQKYIDSSYAPIQVSFTLNREKPRTIYLKEDYAKAADHMMKFTGIDAAFAMGFVDRNNIHISARSGKRIDVSKIMKEMGGGGNPQSAATRIQRDNLLEVEQELMEKVVYGLSPEEAIQGPPQFIKTRNPKKS